MKRGVRLLVLGLVLAGATVFAWKRARTPVSAPASNAPSPAVAEPCRVSPYDDLEQGTGSERSLHVSGDANVDVPGVEIDAETSFGSSLGGTHVTLHDPKSGRRLEVSFDFDFATMASRHPLPRELSGAENETWRRMVENAAFTLVCPRPDPSLARLLDPAGPLLWLPGDPAIPDNYAVLMRDAGGAETWIEYLGFNHGRLGDGDASSRFESVAREGALELLRTAHGAVVRDHERGRYAWIYVYAGGHELRWPSVLGGRLEGRSAVLAVDATGVGHADTAVRIDLDTGAPSPS